MGDTLKWPGGGEAYEELLVGDLERSRDLDHHLRVPTNSHTSPYGQTLGRGGRKRVLRLKMAGGE